MADTTFAAIDGNEDLKYFLAFTATGVDPGGAANPYVPYRKFYPSDLTALTNGLTAITNAVNNPAPDSVTPTNRNNAIATATAEDVFPGGGNPVWTRFRNVGPNDAFYNVGGTASGNFAAGDKQINVGEYVVLPYKTDENISFYSAAGTNIEGEEW